MNHFHCFHYFLMKSKYTSFHSCQYVISLTHFFAFNLSLLYFIYILFSVGGASVELNRLVSDNILWHNLYLKIYIRANIRSKKLLTNSRYYIRWKRLKNPLAYKVISDSNSAQEDWKGRFTSRYPSILSHYHFSL